MDVVTLIYISLLSLLDATVRCQLLKCHYLFVAEEITLVAMGPLTNLALAYRLDDSFSSKLHKLVIMGGNTEGNL